MDTRDDRKGVELRITATDHYWCVFGGCFTRRSEVVIKNNRGYYRSVDFARQWPVRDGWDTLELRECSTDRREVVCAPAKVIWRG